MKALKFNVEALLANILFYQVFFFHLRFVFFVNSEIQPIGLVFCIPFIFYLSFKKKDLRYYLFFLFSVITLSICYLISSGILNSGSFESLLNIFIPISTVFLLKGIYQKINFSFIKYILFLYFWFSFISYYFPSIFINIGVDSVLSNLIHNYSSGPISSIRGIKLLSPEPSYSAFQISFLFFIINFLYHKNYFDKKAYFIYLTMILFLFYTNRSLTLFIIISLFSISYVIAKTKKIYLFFVVIIGFTVIPEIISFGVNKMDSRVFSVSQKFWENIIENNKFGIKELILFSSELGSSREISNYIAYNSVFHKSERKMGAGSWKSSFLDEFYSQGFQSSNVERFRRRGEVNLKPFSLGGLIAFDYGFIGLIIFSIFIFSFFDTILSIKRPPYKFALNITGLFMLFFMSLPTNPIPLILIMIGTLND